MHSWRMRVILCHPVRLKTVGQTAKTVQGRAGGGEGEGKGASCDWSPSAIRMTLLTLLSGPVGFASCSVRPRAHRVAWSVCSWRWHGVWFWCAKFAHTHTHHWPPGGAPRSSWGQTWRDFIFFFSPFQYFFSLFSLFFRFFCKQTRVWHFSLKLTVMYNAGNSRIKNTHTMTPPYPPPMALAQLSFMACRLPLLKNYILTLKVKKKVDEEKK